jgi:hypothetical protein
LRVFRSLPPLPATPCRNRRRQGVASEHPARLLRRLTGHIDRPNDQAPVTWATRTARCSACKTAGQTQKRVLQSWIDAPLDARRTGATEVARTARGAAPTGLSGTTPIGPARGRSTVEDRTSALSRAPARTASRTSAVPARRPGAATSPPRRRVPHAAQEPLWPLRLFDLTGSDPAAVPPRGSAADSVLMDEHMFDSTEPLPLIRTARGWVEPRPAVCPTCGREWPVGVGGRVLVGTHKCRCRHRIHRTYECRRCGETHYLPRRVEGCTDGALRMMAPDGGLTDDRTV